MTTAKSSAFPAGWHKAFYTLWLGCFITGMGYSMTMPFVSLFISDLGNYSKLQINLYSGLAFAMTFIAQAIVSPYWGSLADRKGRKSERYYRGSDHHAFRGKPPYERHDEDVRHVRK